MYEFFTRKVPRTGTPTMSFSKIGTIGFNQAAARLLQKEPVQYILLGWDSTSNKMAMKSISNKKDPRSYRIRYNDKGNGATFSAKTFLDHIGIDYSERRRIPIEVNTNNELFLEVTIPDGFFKRKQQPRIIERERGKAAG